MEVRGRPLHFGVQLQAQRTSWQDYAAALRSVEELGFDSAWTSDHLLPFSGPDDGACFDALTTLAAMATLTSRVRIGVLVNGVLYRDPATLAKSAALVDHISGGRLEFSLGAAWAEREFRTYGLPFPPLAQRYERLDEALQIVRSLWREQPDDLRGSPLQRSRTRRVSRSPCSSRTHRSRSAGRASVPYDWPPSTRRSGTCRARRTSAPRDPLCSEDAVRRWGGISTR